MQRVVIWGLRTGHHSHRYIHSGFYDTCEKLGFDTRWVDDLKESNELLTPGSKVVAVNIASKNLEYRKDVNYVLHNFDNEAFINKENVLRLQVFSKNAKGQNIDESIAKYDPATRTMYQPWGIPSEPIEWLEPNRNPGKEDHWVGYIWNNKANQGNKLEIKLYASALAEKQVQFSHANSFALGVPRIFGGAGLRIHKSLTEVEVRDLVHQSPVGSSVVGGWQKENQYIPCRLFKNVAAGLLPSSNADFNQVFPGISISGDFAEIVESVLSTDFQKKLSLVNAAQELMIPYTYRRAIGRLFDAF